MIVTKAKVLRLLKAFIKDSGRNISGLLSVVATTVIVLSSKF